jgi:hypothetical protein
MTTNTSFTVSGGTSATGGSSGCVTSLTATNGVKTSTGSAITSSGNGFFYSDIQFNALQLSVDVGHFISGTVNLYGV